MKVYSVELHFPDDVFILGSKHNDHICPHSDMGKALAACCKSGDCEDACRYVLEQFKPGFHTTQPFCGRWARFPSTHKDKAKVCRSIYFDSDRDFDESEEWCDIYLIWYAASVFMDRDN